MFDETWKMVLSDDVDAHLADALALSIDCWYANERDQGRAACEYLLAQPDLPDHVRSLTETNLTHYVRPLAELAPSTRFFPLPRLETPGWSWFNPGMVVTDAGVELVVRSSNYSMQPGRRYLAFDRQGVIRSRHYRLRFDARLELLALSPVTSAPRVTPVADFPVRGYEDCRLIQFGPQILAIGVARDHNAGGTCQQFLLRLEDNTWAGALELSAPDDGHQKNWMPFVADGDLLVVQQCWPMTVARIDSQTGRCTVVAQHESTPLARTFRGGSQGIPVDDGWLFVVHEVDDHLSERRRYFHRFIRLDRGWRLTHVSPQLYFSQQGIEYCAGMAQLEEELLLSIGVDDQEAWIVRLPLAEALQLLYPVETLVAPQPRELLDRTTPMADPARTGIVSVTLAGPGTADLIADALRSVIGHVDHCLVVDTGVGAAGVAAAAEVAGDRLIVRELDWPDDFAAARNAALALAADSGAAWAITLDTDERLDLDDIDLGTFLAAARHDLLLMPYHDGSYLKPRAFRLPVRGRWIGQTHEYIDVPAGTHAVMPGGNFSEIPKSASSLRAKLERDLVVLRDLTARQRHLARWWFYLGDTLRSLDDTPGAITAFATCASLPGWDEQAAWARYREAEGWLALGNRDAAIRACTAGLARYPGMAELAWLAGFASWQAGKHTDAIRWSELALVHGAAAGSRAAAERSGFRYPMALYEGPYDVMRYAFRALGQPEEAAWAERRFEEARERRREDPGGRQARS